LSATLPSYGMSRTRYGNSLEAHGRRFLEQEPTRGFVVRRLGLEQIFEIFQAREAIEGMAARLAASRVASVPLDATRDQEKNHLDHIESDPAAASHWPRGSQDHHGNAQNSVMTISIKARKHTVSNGQYHQTFACH